MPRKGFIGGVKAAEGRVSETLFHELERLGEGRDAGPAAGSTALERREG